MHVFTYNTYKQGILYTICTVMYLIKVIIICINNSKQFAITKNKNNLMLKTKRYFYLLLA